MIEVTGEILKVTGSRMLIVPEGPIPGRTPIKVPIKHPAKQYNRLMGWKVI
jgi:hypothetical protein